MARLEARRSRTLWLVGVSVLGLLVGPGRHPARAQTVLVVRPAWVWAALGVDLTSQVRRFPVRGRNLAEVHRRLMREGPVGDDGSHGDALTTYEVSVRWRARVGGERCRVADVRAHADITIDLPEWVDEYRAPDRDVVAWRIQGESLYAHEGEHRDAVLRAAYELVNEVRAQAFEDCPGLSRGVSAVIERVKGELTERQDRIDARRRAAARRQSPAAGLAPSSG